MSAPHGAQDFLILVITIFSMSFQSDYFHQPKLKHFLASLIRMVL
jgi:hypothetical protein